MGNAASKVTSLERLRPWIVTCGLLVLGLALAGGAVAILRDHELRALHAWNGMTGTTSGVVAHRQNVLLANGAQSVLMGVTLILALVLVVPRRVESGWFRWGGWLFGVFGAVLWGVVLLGALGLAIYDVGMTFNPRCPIDGPCNEGPLPLSAASWQNGYLGILSVGALGVCAILMTSLGVRWCIWGVRRLIQGAAQPSIQSHPR